MEGRMERNRKLSPERAKVRSQKPSKQSSNNRKVPVVYYLCRNRQLEHPHFMEVPLSSSKGLFLKDVIERLAALRGRRVASMYSWSCKRSYKNGYVWHDLSQDDLILPAHGEEYVLKGSELFDESNSGRVVPAGGIVLQNQKALPEPPSAGSQECSSSSTSLNGRANKNSGDDEQSPTVCQPCSSTMSPDSSVEKISSWNGSLCLTEYKHYKNDNLADASTQTDEKAIIVVETREDDCIQVVETREDDCIQVVSMDNDALEPKCNDVHGSQITMVKESPVICRDSDSQPPATPGTPSSSDRTDTLESLIRADMRKLQDLRILRREGLQMPSSSKLKPSNMILQLLSCGSISVKDHRFGLIPTYKPTFSNSSFPSPLFSTSFTLEGDDHPANNPQPPTTTSEGKQRYSGRLAVIEEYASTSKQSNSPNVVRMSPGVPNCGRMAMTEPWSRKEASRNTNVEANVVRIEESCLQELGL